MRSVDAALQKSREASTIVANGAASTEAETLGDTNMARQLAAKEAQLAQFKEKLLQLKTKFKERTQKANAQMKKARSKVAALENELAEAKAECDGLRVQAAQSTDDERAMRARLAKSHSDMEQQESSERAWRDKAELRGEQLEMTQEALQLSREEGSRLVEQASELQEHQSIAESKIAELEEQKVKGFNKL